MSIFSGLTPENLRIAFQAARQSPEGVAALAVVGLAMVLALGFAAALATRHIGGFYARVQQEDELAALEEEEQRRAQNEEESENRE